VTAIRGKIYQALDDVLTLFRRRFDHEPIVYGSLGVELLLNRDFDAHDIDIIVEDAVHAQAKAIDTMLRENGFETVGREYLAYRKNGVVVEISKMSYWIETCSLAPDGLARASYGGRSYQVLSLDNQIRLYSYLARLPLRTAEKRQRDEIKLEALRQRLSSR